MDVFEMVFGIVLVCVIAGTINTRIKAKAMGKGGSTGEEGAIEEQLARLDRLEERVKVLERIVTDKHYDLKQKFEDLEVEAKG